MDTGSASKVTSRVWFAVTAAKVYTLSTSWLVTFVPPSLAMSNITLATCEPVAAVIVNAGVAFSSTVITSAF